MEVSTRNIALYALILAFVASSLLTAPAIAENKGKEETCIDYCTGTKSSDQFTGTDADTRFDARAGNDKIDDVANPKKGGDKDTVYAGPGEDSINVDDNDNLDFVDCARGKDRVVADPGDTVLGNCEKVVRS